MSLSPLRWSEDPVVCPLVNFADSFRDPVGRDVVYKNALYMARSSSRRLLKACRGSIAVMLLMYKGKSVDEMVVPCGTASRSSDCYSGIHPVSLLLICRTGSIESFHTFFHKHRSCASSVGGRLSRPRQKLTPTPTPAHLPFPLPTPAPQSPLVSKVPRPSGLSKTLHHEDWKLVFVQLFVGWLLNVPATS